MSSTENSSDPTVWITCNRCGFERKIDRADLISGAWKQRPCPVCSDDESSRQREESREQS